MFQKVQFSKMIHFITKMIHFIISILWIFYNN